MAVIRCLLLNSKYASILAYTAMDIQVEFQENRQIVRIKGKVTFECCPELQRRLDEIADQGAREIVIDFKEVPFIDSSGVGEVLRIFKRMRDSDGEVVLCNPNQKLRDLFSMYRFEKFMKICPENPDGKE
jgi:anti-sigma B factor antagonist